MNRTMSKLAGLLALCSAAISSPAQQTIVFSKPADVSADKANSFIGPASGATAAGDHNAPKSLFNVEPPLSAPIPMPQPPNLLEDKAARDAANKRKNWNLLTAEEIMGVKTPEQILGVDTPKKESKLSLEEQFLLRMLQTASGSTTNARAGNAGLTSEKNNIFDLDKKSQSPLNRSADELLNKRQSRASALSFNDPYKAGNASRPDNMDQINPAWKSAFYQQPQAKQNQEQAEYMERFRSLMAGPSPAATASQNTDAKPVATRDPFLQPLPNINPAGRSAVAIEDNTGRPSGIQPLPAATGSPLPKPKPSSRLTQPPPWMSDGPQPHSLNRSF